MAVAVAVAVPVGAVVLDGATVAPATIRTVGVSVGVFDGVTVGVFVAVSEGVTVGV